MHIKHWYEKDERFFKVLSISGNIRAVDAAKIDISESRLNNMKKDKLIQVVSYPSRYNKQPESNKCYALTNKGKKFIESKYQIQRCQSSNAAEHNCKVAEVICSLDKREIDTVQPEWETRNQMQEALEQLKDQGDYNQYDYYIDLWKSGQVGAIDVVYKSIETGQFTGIEVVTGNYKSDDIAAKEVCSEILEIEVQYISV